MDRCRTTGAPRHLCVLHNGPRLKGDGPEEAKGGRPGVLLSGRARVSLHFLGSVRVSVEQCGGDYDEFNKKSKRGRGFTQIQWLVYFRTSGRAPGVKSPMDYLKRLMRSEKRWRYFLVLIFVVPIIFVLPHARSLVIRNAVTTAYLSKLNAPISGRVVNIGVRAGTVAQADQVGVSIRNEKVDRSRVARLQALKEDNEAEVARLEAHLNSTRSLAEARREEMYAYTEAASQDVTSRLREVNDRSSALQSARKEAESNLERVRKLQTDGLLSQSDLESAESIYQAALADLSANQQERGRLERQLQEIQQSVFNINAPDGALLTRQSVQELDIEVMRLEQALGDSRARMRASEAELESALEAYRNASMADVEVPAGTVVWNTHTALGAWANEGSPILSFVDCSSLLLDVAVDDATLELIEPGMEVNLRLFGSFAHHKGKVILVRGSSALKSDQPVLAAEVENRGNRKGRVLAQLDSSSLIDTPAESCGIGRTAYAEFEGINMFEMVLYPLFR